MAKPKVKRIRAKVGDVFVVPVSGEAGVYGQVVDQTGPQYLVVLFRSTSGSVKDVVGSGIVSLALSLMRSCGTVIGRSSQACHQ